jgi:glycine cleavage system H protein
MDFVVPPNLRYTRTHEWIAIEEDKVRIGLTDYGQLDIGEVLYVEYLLDKNEEEKEQGSIIMRLETPKQIKEISLPISGIIIDINTRLDEEPELINTSPYKEGWLLLLDPTKSYEINQLMNYKEYTEYIYTLFKQHHKRSFWYENYNK